MLGVIKVAAERGERAGKRRGVLGTVPARGLGGAAARAAGWPWATQQTTARLRHISPSGVVRSTTRRAFHHQAGAVADLADPGGLADFLEQRHYHPPG